MDDTPGRVRHDATDRTGQPTEHTREDADPGSVDDRAREIRNEIEETRAEMSETIDAIQERLNPRNIVANATNRVKNAATERVREMADTAGQTAQQAMDYTRETARDVRRQVRQNPIPLALIGVGAAWLLANRSRRSSYDRGYADRGRSGAPRDDYRNEYSSEWSRDEAFDDRGESGVMATIRHNPIPTALAGVGLSWLAYASRERGGRQYAARWGEESREGSWEGQSATGEGMVQKLTDSTNEIASRTKHYVSDASDSVRRMARRRQSQFQRMVQENPLLVGAGALMLGAAFGMAVPETETENEWLGETRDNVVERAREMARDAAGQVQNAAGSVADAAGKIAGKPQQ